MKAKELIQILENGGLAAHKELYRDIERQSARMIAAVNSFTALYGDDREVCLFSVPGRSEVSGNHTDHNHGKVLAAAIDRDIIAVASPTDTNTVRVKSEGYPEDTVSLDDAENPDAYPNYSSLALVAGTAGGFLRRGYKIGGFDAYTTSEVLKGSGISSSAAFEVMIGNMMSHLYNGGCIPNEELAKIAQYAENAYFGKPCGLMDQMACAVGGFVAIDFEKPAEPVIRPIAFSLLDAGYSLCILNTGGNHADLNEDYASVPAEMKAVASYFGKDVLRGITENALLENAPVLRKAAGDRAFLRALHFVRENERVTRQAAALEKGDVGAFFDDVLASGRSSFCYLQNVYTVKNVAEQGLSVALAVTDGLLAGKGCAYRVHGGGFAGTIQVFLKNELAESYVSVMNAIFGEGSAMLLSVRPKGAVRLF